MDQLGIQSISEKTRLDPKSGKAVSTVLRSRTDREQNVPKVRLVQRQIKESSTTPPTATHPDFGRFTAKVRGRKGSIGIGMASTSQDPTNEEMKSDEDESSALPERGSSEGSEHRGTDAETYEADYLLTFLPPVPKIEYGETAAASFEADYGIAAEGAASSSSGQHWTPSVPPQREITLRPKRAAAATPMAASPAVKPSSSAHRKVKLHPQPEKRKLRAWREEEEYDESDKGDEDNADDDPSRTPSQAASPSAESASQLDSQAQEEDAAYIQARVASPVESPEMEPQGPVVVIPWQGQADMPETPRPPQRSKQSKSFPDFRMTPQQLAEHRERQRLDDQQRYEERRRTSHAKAWERSAWWSWHSWAGWQSDQSWEDWQERQQ